jgi:hypothetical protein
VLFTTPAGHTPTISTGALTGTDNSDYNPLTGLTPPITLTSGENNPNIDAGFAPVLSIGNLLWLDADKDGRYDAGETPLDNVVLVLKDLAGNVIATQTTNANGNYLFNDVPPGSYVVEIVASNFGPGGPLFNYQMTQLTGRNDVDNLNNGVAVSGAVQSGVVVVGYNSEPTSESDDPVGGNTNSNLTVDFGLYLAPNAVTLTRFDALRSGSAVRVVWSTSEEVNTLGFYVYRAEGVHAQGALPAGATRINPALISGAGAQGGSYSWLDTTARGSTSYSYFLVEVEIDGKENIYGPAQVRSLGGVFLPVVVTSSE